MKFHAFRRMFLGGACIASFSTSGQVSVSELEPQSALIVPSTLLQGMVFAQQEVARCVAVGTILDENEGVLLKVTSLPFSLHAGSNDLSIAAPILAELYYANIPKALSLQSNGSLPYGKYSQCLEILPGGAEGGDARACRELLSEDVEQFDLFYPLDEDSIRETRPVLTWTSTRPVSLTDAVSEFDLVLVHCPAPCADPASALALELPLVFVPDVNSLVVPFPLDALDLLPGQDYAWQVQRIDRERGSRIGATDVWKFSVIDPRPPKEDRYALLRHDMNGESYTAVDRRVYFRFDEAYSPSGLTCRLFGNDLKPLVPKVAKDERDGPCFPPSALAPEVNGPNLYSLDLQQFGAGTGYFILEVKDEKARTYYLRIHASR